MTLVGVMLLLCNVFVSAAQQPVNNIESSAANSDGSQLAIGYSSGRVEVMDTAS